MGVAWHSKWENYGLITSAEGLVRELVAYDKISLVILTYNVLFSSIHVLV